MKLSYAFPVLFLLIHTARPGFAQEGPAQPVHDTAVPAPISYKPGPRLLEPVTVHAFNLGIRLQGAPASIGVVSGTTLRSFGNAGIVAAVNTIPGVRMEERSPGSYRLAVRGSSLRSPFGVRNVKIYYNGIPFTDPGGNTYLNQLGYYNISGIEIIKGPGSSLYGAGTGGVALIESMPYKIRRGFGIEATAGSYGLLNLEAEARSTDSARNLQSIVRYQHLTSDGYREHSALRRDVLSWDAAAKLSSGTAVNTHFLYTDLHYETPGALTLAEYEADPRSARPKAGTAPGAVSANAAIAQKAFLAGATLEHEVNNHWSYTTTFYGAFTALENPNLRNYSRSSEPHAGGRAALSYQNVLGTSGKIDLIAGAEAQQGIGGIQVYGANGGLPDTLQADDKLNIRTAVAFAQATLRGLRWLLTAGVSINNARMRYARLTTQPYTETIRDFNNEAAPRLAFIYYFGGYKESAAAYGNIARGFSPPTSAELSPSGGALNNMLQAEYGWNYEAGIHGSPVHRRLNYDVNGYYFSLANAIVQRRDAAGGDYYINSGSTQQAGAEASLSYIIVHKFGEPEYAAPWWQRLGGISVRAAYAYQHYRYKDFRQIDADFSGNALPGVAPHTLSGGIDWDSRFGLYARLNDYYSAAFPLNDANSASLDAYNLISARIGFKMPRNSLYGIDIFAGVENMLDVTYSAGPDINGFGGRYYNVAPGRSFYAGIALQRAR